MVGCQLLADIRFGGGGFLKLNPREKRDMNVFNYLNFISRNAYRGIRKRVIFSVENIDWGGDCLQIIFGRCQLVVLSHVQIAVVVVSKLAGSCKTTQV